MIEAIEVKIKVFDQLRGALRIAEVGGSAGLNSGSDSPAIGPIQKAVQQFRHRIRARYDYESTRHWKAMIGQVDTYWDKLFADPIIISTPKGKLRIQPQRTNKILERFFRGSAECFIKNARRSKTRKRHVHDVSS